MWLALLFLALLPADPKPGVDTARLERFLRHYFAWPVELVNVKISPLKPSQVPGFLETTVEVSAKKGQSETQTEPFLISNDGNHVLRGPALRLDQDPFRTTRDQIDLRNQPSFGALIPQVNIVEYSDLQCSYCKQMSNVLRQDVPREFPREVRVFFKDFPLTDIHPWAMDAAVAGRCIFRQDPEAFWSYHDWAYQQQAQLTAENFREKALEFAGQRGLGIPKLVSCMLAGEARAEVERSFKEGKALGVSGTPTLFVNGRRLVGNQPLPALKQVIQTELEYAKGLACDHCASRPAPPPE